MIESSSGIYLVMPVCEYFGAGTCGKYLLREFAARGPLYFDWVAGEEGPADSDTRELVRAHFMPLRGDVDLPLIQFAGPELEQQTKYRGRPNVAYLFSEWEPITAKQRENLRGFDVLIAGSTWNAEIIRACGFACAAVAQGVDRQIFRPLKRLRINDQFFIYSGGKFESRKAQDLVIRAVKVLQQRHPHIFLVASWFNIWDNADHYAEAEKQGIRLIGLPLLDHKRLAFQMNQTDVGLFPNRCEGGTNLVMMDYLACGKPVVANVSTGQADVLDDTYALLMRGTDDELVEQMIEGVETLYHDRALRELMGAVADEAMDRWSWSRTADGIEKAIQEYQAQVS